MGAAATWRLTAVLVLAGSIRPALGREIPRAAHLEGRRTPAQAAPSAGSGLLLGRVVSAATDEPVTGAVVTLSLSATGARGTTGPFEARVLVDGQGRFVFFNLPAGDVSLTADAAGYMPGSGMPGDPTATLHLADGQRLSDVIIRLWRFGAIGGSVFDEYGQPLAGVPVHLLRRTAGAHRLAPSGAANTDDRGAFRFWSLEPGRYVVAVPSTTTSLPVSIAEEYLSQLNPSVSPLLRGPVTAAPEPAEPGFRIGDMLLQPLGSLARAAPPPSAGHVLVYRTTFAPSATAASETQDIVLGAGDDRSAVDVTLTLAPTTSVSGTVTGPDGPVSRLDLTLVPAATADWADSEGFATASTVTDERGAFTFLGVPPGQYIVTGATLPAVAALARGDAIRPPAPGIETAFAARWIRSTVIVGDSPITGLALASHPAIRVSGRLRFAGSAAPPTADLLRDVAVSLSALTHQDADTAARGSIAADGRFEIDGIMPGSYAVEVSSPGAPWTLASIAAGDRDLLRRPLILDADVTDLTIVFTDRPPDVAGVIQSTNANEPFTVLVFPTEYQAAADAGMLSRGSRIVAVDTSRQFSIGDLPPGDYFIAAVPSEDIGRWKDPDGIRAIAAQATTLSLVQGARQTVTLRPVVVR